MISFLRTLKNSLKNPYSKEIKFSLMDKYKIENSTDDFWLPPIPVMKRIPEWYKKMVSYNQDLINQPTIKKCPPVLEIYRHGYYILNSVDISIKQMTGPNGFDSFIYEYPPNYSGPTLINEHGRVQVHKVPLIDKWKSNHANKYNNPWLIKTPPGYSCLFVSPLNNSDDRFTILPGIVDTDKYPTPPGYSTLFLNPTINDVSDTYYAFEAIVDTDKWHEINFPFIVNWNKINLGQEYVFKRGDPIVLAIPFKRTNFNLNVSYNDKKLNKTHKQLSVNKGMNFSNFYKKISDRMNFK